MRALLDRDDRSQALGLLLLMIFGALLEMTAVSLMFPLIQVISTPGANPTMPLAQWLRNFLAPTHPEDFAIQLLAFLVLFYIVKNLFFGMLLYLQNRFGFRIQTKISSQLFHRYLNQPYTFHLQRNTADLLRNLTYEADQIVWSVMIPALALVTEALVAASLVTLLFVSSIQAAIVISSIFGITGFLYYRLFRERIQGWGAALTHHEGQRIRAIHEGMGSLKELKVLGRNTYFLNRYAAHNRQRARFASKHSLALGSNLLLLEVLGISSLLALVAIHLLQGNPFSTLLPMMGVFAGAAFRLIPATNRIINNFQHVQYAAPIIRNLRNELSIPLHSTAEETVLPIGFEDEIRLENVAFGYRDGQKVLEDVSLTISKGETIGVVGDSGAGKTTLLDLVLGILSPDRGQISVDRVNIATGISGWQKLIGYIPQGTYLLDGTIRQNVAFALDEDEIDDARVSHALRGAQLEEFVTRLTHGVHTNVGELGKRLSGGQRQRIGIARALYLNPQILVLDEATSALDTTTETEVLEAIRRMHGQKTIIIITHRTSMLRCCDRILRLEDGRLAPQHTTITQPAE
ncbi:MAG: ABC transporter ATP-binding protein [Proteobacteria bacterium]|nr:ABC transporter ATP-binding protein [Pseudomonadota bacterium]HQR04002.1 ABC transporter ATP-binding protein [Rhodocyclaceae bacterium]